MAFCTQTSLSWLWGSEDEGGGLRLVVALSSQPLCPAQLSQSAPGGSRGAASTSRPQARGRGRGRTGCVFTHVPRERVRAADGQVSVRRVPGGTLELLEVADVSHRSNLLPHAAEIHIPLNPMVLPGPWSRRYSRALFVPTTEEAATKQPSRSFHGRVLGTNAGGQRS